MTKELDFRTFVCLKKIHILLRST